MKIIVLDVVNKICTNSIRTRNNKYY